PRFCRRSGATPPRSLAMSPHMRDPRLSQTRAHRDPQMSALRIRHAQKSILDNFRAQRRRDYKTLRCGRHKDGRRKRFHRESPSRYPIHAIPSRSRRTARSGSQSRTKCTGRPIPTTERTQATGLRDIHTHTPGCKRAHTPHPDQPAGCLHSAPAGTRALEEYSADCPPRKPCDAYAGSPASRHPAGSDRLRPAQRSTTNRGPNSPAPWETRPETSRSDPNPAGPLPRPDPVPSAPGSPVPSGPPLQSALGTLTRPVSAPRANRDTTQSELPAYSTAPEATGCTAVDPASLEAEAPAPGLGMYLDLAAMEARHPEAPSGPAHCRARYTAARSALTVVPDPPERPQLLRACPSTGPAPPRKCQSRAPSRSSTRREE